MSSCTAVGIWDLGIYPHLMFFVTAATLRNTRESVRFWIYPAVDDRALCLKRRSWDCCITLHGVMAGSCRESCVVSSCLLKL